MSPAITTSRAFILRPRSAERTDITCHFLFETHELRKPTFDPADAVEFWDLVNRQDWTVCESVQEGIGASVHTHGYYAPDGRLESRHPPLRPSIESGSTSTNPEEATRPLICRLAPIPAGGRLCCIIIKLELRG